MKHTKNYLLIFVLLTLFSSCKNQTVDIEKERQNAVKEYVAKMETERQQKLDVVQKFYGVFASGDMSVLPEILAANYTQYPSDPGRLLILKASLNMLKTLAVCFLI